MFSKVFPRLLGMHGLSASQAAKLLGTTEVALSAWKGGRRDPSLRALLKIGEFFEVPPHELMSADFGDLLAGPLGDPERYHRVEKKIKLARTKMQAVQEQRESAFEEAARKTGQTAASVRMKVVREARKRVGKEQEVRLGNNRARLDNAEEDESA